MSYPTMCCEVESTKTCCEPVKEAGMAVQLDVVKKRPFRNKDDNERNNHKDDNCTVTGRCNTGIKVYVR